MTSQEISLVIEAQNGSAVCFEELYVQYHKKVFAVIKTMIRNDADAEDILQQTFLNAWRNLKNLLDPSAFNTWIQRIAINLCKELLRKKNIAILLESEDIIENVIEDSSEDLLPAIYAEREDLRVRISRILDGLSEVQRQTIVLYYFNELKIEEIADVMECSAGTVKTRLFLARKTIRSEIEEHERKSGQKFYGVAGIPLLAFSEILAEQIEASTISPVASSSILESISSTIAGVGTASTAASSAGVATSVGSAAGVAGTGMAITTKIIIGIVSAAVITTGALVIPKLINAQSESEVPHMSPAISGEVSATHEELPAVTTEPSPPIITEEPEDILSPISMEGSASLFEANGWIYYILDGFDYSGIMRTTVDGEKSEMLTDSFNMRFYIYNDKLYYRDFEENSGIYRMELDGRNPELVLDNAMECITIINNWLYFISDSSNNRGSIFKIRLDGSEMTQISEPVFVAFYSNGWIYFNDYSNIGRVNLETEQTEMIVSGLENIVYTTTDDEWIYFAEFEGDTSTEGICRISIESGDIEYLTSTSDHSLIYRDGWIYFARTIWVDVHDNGLYERYAALYRKDVQTGKEERLANEEFICYDIGFINDYLCFTTPDALYQLPFDGGVPEKVSKGVG